MTMGEKSFIWQINEKVFNQLWRSIARQEEYLLERIAEEGDDGDEIALFSNDLVHLRLCKSDLEDHARESGFDDGCFSLSEDSIDLNDLI